MALLSRTFKTQSGGVHPAPWAAAAAEIGGPGLVRDSEAASQEAGPVPPAGSPAGLSGTAGRGYTPPHPSLWRHTITLSLTASRLPAVSQSVDPRCP